MTAKEARGIKENYENHLARNQGQMTTTALAENNYVYATGYLEAHKKAEMLVKFIKKRHKRFHGKREGWPLCCSELNCQFIEVLSGYEKDA